ncbi:MAG: hypothetical protein EZS28_042097, partial [Streblomastix strix]
KDDRQVLLASGGEVLHDRIMLTVSYATTGQYAIGYLFKSYLAEARPKPGDQEIALVGTNTPNTFVESCNIDQYGPYIICN